MNQLGMLRERICRGIQHLYWMESWAFAREDGVRLKTPAVNKGARNVADWRGRLVGLQTVHDVFLAVEEGERKSTWAIQHLESRIRAYQADLASDIDNGDAHYAKGFVDAVRIELADFMRGQATTCTR